MNRTEARTYTAVIYVAGDLGVAKAVCREFCMVGLCVTVESADFIYTGGSETGVRVGLINYPRSPVEPETLFATAEALALKLIEGLYQNSASVVAPDRTLWLSRRPEP